MALLDTVVHIEQHPKHYGLYWQQKQWQVKRLIEEVGGSENALAGRDSVLTRKEAAQRAKIAAVKTRSPDGSQFLPQTVGWSTRANGCPYYPCQG